MFMLPATIAQLNKASDTEGKPTLFDREVGHVKVIGTIQELRVDGTKYLYLLSDLSGSNIEVQQFLDGSVTADVDQMSLIHESNWVVVYGTLKHYQGKRMISAFRVAQLRFPNELTTQMLEVIDISMYLSAAAKGIREPTSSASFGGFGTSNDNAGGGFQESDGRMNGLSPLQKQIMKMITDLAQREGERGVHDVDIIARFAPKPERDVRDALKFLVDEGHVYTSSDDFHYMVTS